MEKLLIGKTETVGENEGFAFQRSDLVVVAYSTGDYSEC